MKKNSVTLVALLSFLVGFVSARYSRINGRSAIDDYLEFFPQPEVYLSVPPKVTHSAATHSPKVRQTNEQQYDGYRVRKDAFSQTEAFNYALQFKIGAQLDQNYKNSDECFDAWVHILDDVAFYENNVTDTKIAISENKTNNWWFNYLNLTGIMFGPVSEILVECYKFGNSVADYEINRFLGVYKQWDAYLLAFLFNQMGNAIYFESKFRRIEKYRNEQLYQSIWFEYGDLFQLIWDFDPLPEASYDSIQTAVANWLEDYSVNGENAKLHQMVESAGVPTVARYILDTTTQISDAIEYATQQIKDYFEAQRAKKENFVAATKLNTFMWTDPWTIPAFDTNSDLSNLAYGLGNGIIDVFPYESNPNRCRNNITQTYGAVQNWVKFATDSTMYDLWNNADDRLSFVKEMSYVLEFPFGVCYSCYWAFVTVMIDPPPKPIEQQTEDERLETMITLGHDIPTNLFFNAGYMYGDIFQMYSMADTTNKYWEKFGRYLGDAFIRIFWRRKFTRNFEYDITEEN